MQGPPRDSDVLRSEAGAASLSQRVVSSGLWLAALAGTGRLIGFVRLAALARFLGPREFGVVGAALVTIGMLEALSDLGLFLALINRRETSRELLDTAWTLGVIRGLLLGAATFLAAPWIGAVFASPEAVDVIRAMALVPLIGSLANVGMVEFRRQLAFGRFYVIQVSAIVVDLLVAVPLAIWLRNAWALVAGWLALSMTRVLLSYGLHPYRPAFRLVREHVAPFLSYGRWITGSTAFQWVMGDGVAALVGRLFGIEGLGLYQMAWRVTGQPANEVGALVSAATVSAYARLQGSRERISFAYLRVLQVAMVGSVPLWLGFALYATDIVRLVFGPLWEQSAGLARVLALFALASTITAVTQPVFPGVGRPRDQALVSLLEALMLAVSLPLLLARFGLAGAVAATLARGLAGACASLYLVERCLGIRWSALFSAVVWPLVACLSLVLLRLGLFSGSVDPAGLLVAVCLSAMSYAGGLFLLERLALYRIKPGLSKASLRGLRVGFGGDAGLEVPSADVTKGL